MLTIVFDLDGTLIDTAPDLIDTLNLIFAHEGLPAMPYDDGAQYDRRRRQGMIERALAAEGRAATSAKLEPTCMQRFHRPLCRAHRRPLAALSQARSHARTALPRPAIGSRSAPTSSNGCRCGFCRRSTSRSTSPRSADRTLSACRSPIRMFSGGPSARWRRGRPAAIMVGDSKTDIRTARAANVPVDRGRLRLHRGPDRELGAGPHHQFVRRTARGHRRTDGASLTRRSRFGRCEAACGRRSRPTGRSTANAVDYLNRYF